MAFRSKLISSSKFIVQNPATLFSSSRSLSLLNGAQYAAAKGNNESDKETHTGQVFEKDDYRLARFVNKKKEVNERFAIDLINEVPPKEEKDRVVWCDGGGGPTGHPRVYINLDQKDSQICGYCGLRFYKDHKHH